MKVKLCLIKSSKEFFQSIYLISKGGGIKNKWTTGPPGNIQNYNLQAFVSPRLSTDCGPHILHTQLPLAPALYFTKKNPFLDETLN